MVTTRTKILQEIEVIYEPGKLFYLDVDEVPAKFKGGHEGHAMISYYEDPTTGVTKARIAFIPKGHTHLSPTIVDFSEIRGGLNANLHAAIAVMVKADDHRTVVFGKAASVTYAKRTGKKVKAHRTYWSIKFTNVRTARAFEIIVKHLASQTANNEEDNQTEADVPDKASKAINKEENEVSEEAKDLSEGANGGKEEVGNEVSDEANEVSDKADEVSEEADTLLEATTNSLSEEAKDSSEEDNGSSDSSDDDFVAQSQQLWF
jgi:hypothetical protein